MQAAGDRLTRENDLAITQAWTTAVLTRADKLPKLEEMLAKTNGKDAKPDLPDDVKNALLVAAFQDFSLRVPKAPG